MPDISDVIKIAEAEVGYLEKASNSQLEDPTANAGSGNWTKYARDLDKIAGWYNGPKNGYEWCAVFFDWVLIKVFGAELVKKMTNHTTSGAGCTWAAQAYVKAKQWAASPAPGDQIFFGSDLNSCTHTGIVYKVASDRVYTIEGNTSGASGEVANGGGVCKKSYAKSYSRIVGYGRPKYELGDEEMTGEEIYNKLYEFLAGKECPEWAQAELREAIDAGITDGTRPMMLATRLETALMTKRAAEKK